MPASPEKRYLLARVQEAVLSSGWQMIFENDDHPCLLRAFRGDKTIRMLVYIWRLTRGGPPGVRPSGEFRIQLTGVRPPLVTGKDFVTVLLGWHESSGVFAGFDVFKRPRGWGRSPSVQIRDSALEDAVRTGFGQYRRATKGIEMAIAFSPSCFMEYVLNQKRFHEFADFPEEVKVLDEALRAEGDYEAEKRLDLDRIGSHGRREVVRAVMERLGQENFRGRVLTAYRRHCAMCGLQLDLVVAAHIVPVNVKGTNETSNGLSLCYLHHEAYDRAFVVPDDEYRIRVNESAMERLRRLKRNSKEQEFRHFLRPELFLPERQQDRPSPAYLRRGMQLRGWPEAVA